MSRLVARGSASLAHSLKMTAGFVGDPASPETLPSPAAEPDVVAVTS
jgi:hypothetical protein